jgi:hypothetical protein
MEDEDRSIPEGASAAGRADELISDREEIADRITLTIDEALDDLVRLRFHDARDEDEEDGRDENPAPGKPPQPSHVVHGRPNSVA